MNYAACASLPRTPENSRWYRLIQLGYFKTPLASAHTKAAVSRFNPGTLIRSSNRFACLYFADDPTVALFEAGAQLGKFGAGRSVPQPGMSFAVASVHVVLRDVADTSELGAQTALSTTVQELTGDWEGYGQRSPATNVKQPTGHAPTQELGFTLFQTGVEAFRAVSARVPTNRTLIVFPDNMRIGSSLRFDDAHSNKIHEVIGKKP